MKKYIIYILLNLSLLLGHSYQDSYWFRRLDLDNTIIKERIFTITQDSIGYMWFGTIDGLFKYDGHEVIHFDQSLEPGGLKDDRISSIYVDKKGDIWVLTKRSFEKYIPETEQFLNIELPKIKGNYSYITEDDRNNLIISSDRGEITIYNKETESIAYRTNIDSHIRDTYYLQNKLYIATDQGLQLFDLRKRQVTEQFTSESCYCLEKYDDQTLLVGLESRMRIFNTTHNKPGRKIELPYKDKPHRIWDICKGMNGNIWISVLTQNIFLYNLKTDVLRQSDEANGIYNLNAVPPIFDIYRSYSGTIWVGSAVSGLYKSKMVSRVQHVSKENHGLSGNHIKVLFEDNRGNIWIGTNKNGITIYNPESHKYITLKDINPKHGYKKTYDKIFSFFQDDKKYIWAGGDGYLIRIRRDDYRTKIYDIPDSLKYSRRTYVKAVAQIKPHIFLLGTLGSGLIKFNTLAEKFSKVTGDYSDLIQMSRGYLNFGCLESDQKGNIWAGLYSHGLLKLDLEEKPKSEKISYMGLKINNIFYEDSANVWICTRKGLYNYNDAENSFIHYNVKDGLLSNNVLDIIKVDSVNYWLSTNVGMVKFDSDNQSFTNYSEQYNFRYFYQGADNYYSDSSAVNNIIIEENTLLFSKDNYIYIGGANGIDKFKPKDVAPNFKPPKVYISGMSIVGEDTSFARKFPLLDRIKLSYKDYKFTFDYNIFSYHIPDKNQLAYKLVGYNKKWIKTRDKNFAFSNVPPGEYILKTKGRDAFGHWASGQSVRIIITPPFWKTTKFIVLSSALLIFLIVAAIRYRTKTIQAQKKILDRKVRIRTEELNQKKNELQAAHDKLEERVDERTRQLLNANQKLREEIEERKRIQRALHKSRKDIKNNLKQQGIITEISMLFNTMRDFRKKINQTLDLIQQYIQSELVNIYEKVDNKRHFEISYIKTGDSIPELAKESRVLSGKMGNFFRETFQSKGLIEISDLNQLPEDIPKEFKATQINSFLASPIYIDDSLIGVLLVGNIEQNHDWHSTEKNLIRTVSNLLTNAYQKNKIEKDLIKSEKTSKSLVNAPKEPSLLLNEDGNILLCNESFAKLLNRDKENLIGQNLRSYLSNPILQKVEIRLQNSINKQNPENFEIEVKNNYYNISIYPINYMEDESSTAAAFIRDITYQKEAEQVLKNNQEKLEKLVDKRTEDLHEANLKLKQEIDYRKMAEKELVATEKKKREDLRKLTLQLAHEIKNPLASIKSSVQILKYMFENSSEDSNLEKMLEKMEMINNNVDICNKVVQELYSYTHRGGMQLEDNNLAMVLEEIRNYAESKAENFERINIETDFQVTETTLSLDLFKILQAFKNLINNAFDAIEEEGTIAIHAKRVNQTIQIDIEDNGQGIGESEKGKIFDPFYTTKVKGFGIGLSVVQEIINSHDGSLEITSTAGQGTNASVKLPIVNK
ncbi:MAG: PAS domain S-box protein [Candidatus Marinimicrobia bacterium]|nr:PAS domain S-box protein [Candidatus Neomarinimicrobiota bacterium]